MSEEKRLMIENDLCMNKSKAQVIKLYLDLMERYNKEIEEYQLELEKADSITQSCIFQGKQESEISFRNCLNKMTKYKIVLDKIKEYCNHKLEMLELQKRNIMQILTPENGYLKTDIEIEMQKYKDILELLEEIE